MPAALRKQMSEVSKEKKRAAGPVCRFVSVSSGALVSLNYSPRRRCQRALSGRMFVPGLRVAIRDLGLSFIGDLFHIGAGSSTAAHHRLPRLVHARPAYRVRGSTGP